MIFGSVAYLYVQILSTKVKFPFGKKLWSPRNSNGAPKDTDHIFGPIPIKYLLWEQIILGKDISYSGFKAGPHISGPCFGAQWGHPNSESKFRNFRFDILINGVSLCSKFICLGQAPVPQDVMGPPIAMCQSFEATRLKFGIMLGFHCGNLPLVDIFR